MFKMAKKWGSAGEAFSKSAELHLKNGSKHDAATNWVDAATCYKKTDTKGNHGNYFIYFIYFHDNNYININHHDN